MTHVAKEKLTDMLTPEIYHSWEQDFKLVFYSAGTGKGKTHMVISAMAKELFNKSFLYLTNRKRLDSEIKTRVNQYDAENVESRTYQNLENMICS